MTSFTELEGVNEILDYLNELRVDSLVDLELNSVADTAQRTLESVSKEIQIEGPPECREDAYEITLDGSGYINIPSTALYADLHDFTVKCCVRDDKLYNLDDHTFDWTDVFGTQAAKVDIIWYREFGDLVIPTQRYVTLLAARRTHLKIQGDTTTNRLIEQDLREAKAKYRQYCQSTTDSNYLGDALSQARLSRRRTNRVNARGF